MAPPMAQDLRHPLGGQCGSGSPLAVSGRGKVNTTSMTRVLPANWLSTRSDADAEMVELQQGSAMRLFSRLLAQ